MEEFTILFKNTLSNNRDDIINSEEKLLQLEAVDDFFPSLLKYVMTEEIEFSYRQAGSIYFKRGLLRKWKEMNEKDKNFIRGNLLETLGSSHRLIRNQLTQSIKFLIFTEFPDLMSDTFDKSFEYIKSNDIKLVFAGLIGLRFIVRKYEYAKNQWELLNEIISRSFPTLLNLLEESIKNGGEESAHLIKLILKIFWSSVHQNVPPYLVEGNNFENWIKQFLLLLERPIQENEQNSIEDERDRDIWWKCKKWVMYLVNKFFQSYMIKSIISSDYIDFSNRFINEYSTPLLESCITLLNQRKEQDMFLTDRVLRLVLSVINTCLLYSKTWKIMKPHIDLILLDTAFPLICFKQDDEEKILIDPHEYVRLEFDFGTDLFFARHAARKLFLDFCLYRGGNGMIENVMMFLVSLLNDYNENPEDLERIIRKEGALCVLGILAPKLLVSEEYATQLEELLTNHVLPEFNSKYTFLRARTCWMFSQFAKIEWQNMEIKETCIQNVLKSLEDEEMVVKLQAALALENLIYYTDNLSELLKDILPQLIQTLLLLITETGFPEIIGSVNLVINKFQEDIEPYAQEICENLCNSIALIKEQELEQQQQQKQLQNDDDFNSSNLNTTSMFNTAIENATMNTFKAIYTLLIILKDKPKILYSMQKILYPILSKCVNPSSTKFFESILDISSLLTYYSTEIIDEWLDLLALFIQAYSTWAEEFIKTIAMTIDNIISKINQRFVTYRNSEILELVINVSKFLIADEELPSNDSIDGCQIIESLFQNSTGRIDSIVTYILEFVLKRFINEKRSLALKIFLLGVIGNALLYNPSITLGYLVEQKAIETILMDWSQIITNAKINSIHNKKVALLGLSSIFHLDFKKMPVIIQDNLPLIFQVCIILNQQIAFQKETQKSNYQESSEGENENEKLNEKENEKEYSGEEYSEEESDYESDDDLGYLKRDMPIPDTLNDDENAMDETTMKVISTLFGEFNSVGLKTDQNDLKNYQEEEEEEEEEEEDEEYVDEGVDFTCPIDNIHETEFFVKSFSEFSNINQNVAQLIEKNLDPEIFKDWDLILQSIN
ncbi:d-importin 7/ranbp7 [Anaeramoeba flamelloides]|uniref:D-importin 7/ranbp7 n=1 Tax=Anaeramoeba flamelloides TaxID=1746091 RepID=A0ABQ8Z1W4_9EUKA|nr:d-importin 7/ranbp7 [Anaeramoeba flamelloides]